jgi:uncharacterized protein with von Willebrand factor type A (vWA) domain
MAPLSIPLDQAIVGLCRYARANGLTAGVKETMDGLQAAEAVGVNDREILKMALRAVLCSSHSEWDLFDQLFDDFWSSLEPDSRSARRSGVRARSAPRPETKQQKERAVLVMPGQGSAATPEAPDGKGVVGATANERLRQRDFSDITAADIQDLERVAMRLLRQMSLRLSRRLKSSNLGGQVDLRRTIRRSISSGGDPIDLSFRRRWLQQLKLVILLDVSGSMNAYSLFLVRFAYAMQKYFKHADTFLFSTRLTNITTALRSRNLQDALGLLSQETSGWSGGTKIGASLRELNVQHGRLLTRNTLFIILSDGWETGETEILSAELPAIKRRVRKVLWLNPLLGMEGYEPLARGMSAALPYIDVFAPAHNLESLLALEPHLRRA